MSSFTKINSLLWEVVIRRRIAWADLESIQEKLKSQVLEDPQKAYFLISEPLPTFTYGKQAEPSDLLWDSNTLATNKVSVAPVSRGGKWTYHGPGQILCYPIAHLGALGFPPKSAALFAETLRAAVQKACAAMGVSAHPLEEPFGLYVNQKKLASFGMSFQGGISTHGVAVYLSPQEPYFSGIHPCGQKHSQFTSLQDSVPFLSWGDSAATLVSFLEKGFKIT